MELLLHPLTASQLGGLDAQAGSVIFSGPAGLGRTAAVLQLAQRLNCPAGGGDDCVICRQITGGNFPDLVTLFGQSVSIGIEEIERLQAQLIVSPYYQHGQRIVVVEPAETLTLEAQNRFLKTLEEPPPRTLIVLVTTAAEALIPTIRSRCAEIRFLPPPPDDVTAALVRAGHSKAAVTEVLALGATGPAESQRWLSDGQMLDNRRRLSELTAAALVAPLYQRLLLVPQLLALGCKPSDLIQVIRRQLTASVSDDRLITALAALERFGRRTHAKVAPKVALEGLMLEL